MIDADNKSVQVYIDDINRQREQVKKNESKKQKRKPLKTNKSSKKQKRNKRKKKDPVEIENLDAFEMKRRAQFADMRKRELQVLVMEKKFLPIEFIDGVYIKYIETFNSTMERLSSTYINDVGKKILESGEILPEHIEKFTSLILEAIHNNKKAVKRLIKDYEPSL